MEFNLGFRVKSFLGLFVLFIGLFTLIAFSFGAVDTAVIDVAIVEAFDESAAEPVRVIVVLEDDLDDLELLEMSNGDLQETVDDLQGEFFEELTGELSDEQVSDIEVLREFEETAAVTLELSDESVLDEIIATGKVAGVYLDQEVSVSLDLSVPVINGDEVWEYDAAGDSSGLSITGHGETICVIDTGIDYTHESLGACNPLNYSISGTEETLSSAVESTHPYTNSLDVTYVVNMSGYENISIHFDYIKLEAPGDAGGDATDRVIIYNEDNETIAIYKGDHLDVWTPHSNGSILYVRLVTDGSVTDDGFYVDKALNGTANTTMDWSSCSKVIGGWDTFNSDNDPMDDHYHGTHVAGIVASDHPEY